MGSNVWLADPVARFLLAVAVIVVVCHLLAALVGMVGQPPVVGEIAGGLILGPLALGTLWPRGHAWLFPPPVVANLQMIAQLGLVMFTFLLGCELRLRGSRSQRAAIGWVVFGAMGLPFLGGVGIAALGASALAGSAGSRPVYLVVFGLAVSITALPVLARILADTGLEGTRIGSLAMACAAAGDGVTWVVLTVTLSVSGLGQHRSIWVTASAVAAFVLATVFGVRPALASVVGIAARSRRGDQLLLPLLAGGALAFGAVTQFIGLHPIIGAFLFGAVVPRDEPQVGVICRRLQGFAVTILLPLFFAGIGMSTVIGPLARSAVDWLVVAGVLVAAIVTKSAGAVGGARLAGLDNRDALRLGVLMNCRGVTELVVAAIAWQYHLISPLGLTTLVLVALLTTAMTTPAIRRAFGAVRAAVPGPPTVPVLEAAHSKAAGRSD
jgi:Kef-type K+ transport system membrane component KefB